MYRLALALAFSLLLTTNAAAQDDDATPIQFEWSVPARFGPDRDGDGLVDYPKQPVPDSFPVDFKLTTASCVRGATYRWSVDGDERAETPHCTQRLEFAREGTYEVAVERGDARYAEPIVVEDWLIVSLGDSVASGEGNPDVRGNAVRGSKWQDRRCHRSARAGPAVAARLVEQQDDHTSVTFMHFACSGATIAAGLIGPYPGVEPLGDEEIPPQVEQVRALGDATSEIDAVVLSVGANDIYFGPLVTFCIRHSRCFGKSFDPDRGAREALGLPVATAAIVVSGALDRLRSGYDDLALKLAESVPPDRVLATEYFDPTRDEDGEFCSRALHIKGAEWSWAFNSVLAPLNEAFQSGANRHGWKYVAGISDAFARHGYCAGTSARWVRLLNESFFRQGGGQLKGRFAGTLHPNEAGHDATGELIAANLTELLQARRQQKLVVADDAGTVGAAEGAEDEATIDEPLEWLAVGGAIVAVAFLVGTFLVWVRRYRRGWRPSVTPDRLVLTLTPLGGACFVVLAVAARDDVALAVVFAVAGSIALLAIPVAVVYRSGIARQHVGAELAPRQVGRAPREVERAPRRRTAREKAIVGEYTRAQRRDGWSVEPDPENIVDARSVRDDEIEYARAVEQSDDVYDAVDEIARHNGDLSARYVLLVGAGLTPDVVRRLARDGIGVRQLEPGAPPVTGGAP